MQAVCCLIRVEYLLVGQLSDDISEQFRYDEQHDPGSSALKLRLVFWMLISRSDAVSVRVPSCSACMKDPFQDWESCSVWIRTFETVFRAFSQ